MDEIKTVAVEDASQPRKGRASVQYPYFDLADSLDVARKMHDNAGGTCTPDQLASYLGYKSTNSGTYQTRISSAKQFGFIRSDDGQLVVTERAMKIISPVMPEDAVTAKADAFLAVDLFAKVYEKYKNVNIPPKVGMRNLLAQSYSLTGDRLDPAVRVLFESAEEAGMFPAGDQTRLVRPAAKPSSPGHRPHSVEAAPPAHEHRAPAAVGGHDGGPPGVHTAIIGLLRELPPAGTQWPNKAKARFVKAFLATLDFVYQSDDDDEPKGGTTPAP